jgi:hypothetical protein
VVLIQTAGGFARCTGTVITENAVLTAAHCLQKGPFAIEFSAKPGYATPENTRIVQYGQVIPHPMYVYNFDPDPNVIDHDVGLLIFEGGLPQGYHPIPMVSPAYQIAPQEFGARKVGIYGYGMTNNPAAGGGLLTAIATLTNFTPGFKFEISNLSPSEGAPCPQDSGGPLFLVDAANIPFLAGVAITSDCGETTSPNIRSHYNDLRYYGGWIVETLASQNLPLPIFFP